jgi:nitrite reductase/ring-hydroxylating ferredoxin subunit
MGEYTDRDAADAAGLGRRTVLGLGLAGAAGVALAACGNSAESTGTPSSATSGGGTPTPGGSSSQVPVGGAAIIPVGDTAYVVAQPTQGQFVAHSAVCPHQGCLCNEVAGSKAICPCHGSEFNTETGAVEKGPATKGLAPATVTVTDGTLMLPS